MDINCINSRIFIVFPIYYVFVGSMVTTSPKYSNNHPIYFLHHLKELVTNYSAAFGDSWALLYK